MGKNKYPRIHLVMDNCFAIKRWVEPYDWMSIIKKIGGITKIQASTDNEISPVLNTQSFRDKWTGEVEKYEKEFGMEVVSFYSGYAEYRTVGLASFSQDKRQTLINRYFKPIVDVAQRLGAQVGNTLSAYSDPVLQQPELFEESVGYVDECLAQMAKYADERKVLFGYEQMYSPMQGMWTIEWCKDCMKRVKALSGSPLYITIDTAHQVAQGLFKKPGIDDIIKMQAGGDTEEFRLPDEIISAIRNGKDLKEILCLLEKYDYWFAEPQDADVYEWLGQLGCYSPIVHLQQTDGTYSGHKPFTKRYNESGIIHPKEVFRAIKRSYDADEENGLPSRVEDIYLAFELFFGAGDSKESIINQLSESVQYWRKYLPEDGMNLQELV